MNVTIRLVVILVLMGSFDAQGMNKIQSQKITKLGKNVFNKKIPKESFSTSPLFNRKFKPLPKNLVIGKEFSEKKYDLIPKIRSYSTDPEISNNIIAETTKKSSNSDYKNNSLIKKWDDFYNQNINEILAEAYNKSNFIKIYAKISNNYGGESFWDKETKETRQYDAYKKERYKELEKIVESNENYKENVDDYNNTERQFNSKEFKELVKKIEKIKKTIEQNEYYKQTASGYDDQKEIPLLFFKSFLVKDQSPFSSSPSSSNNIIAARLIHLMNTLENRREKKDVTPDDIRTNPYFDDSFRFIRQESYAKPQLKELFNKACDSFEIPNTIEEYLDFLAKPCAYSKITLVERIFVDAFIKNYLLFAEQGRTANKFVQFLEILKKMKNDKEFRESAMEILGLNKSDARYKEGVKNEKAKKGGFWKMFTRSYSTSQQRQSASSPKIKNIDQKYENNSMVNSGAFYGKSINQILEKALKENKFFFVYGDLYNEYVPNPEGWREDSTKTEKEYDEYRKEKFNELNNIIESNDSYKKEIQYYNKIITSMKSTEVINLANNIKNIENETAKKEYLPSDLDRIPLRYFKRFLNWNFSMSGDKIIAARLLELMESLKNINYNKTVSVEDIETNPYFYYAFDVINELSKYNPDFKELFNDACESFIIPKTIEDYLMFLAKPFKDGTKKDFKTNVNPVENIFGNALIKGYLLPSDSKKTAEGFAQFLAILQKMKDNKIYRKSAMEKLGIDLAEKNFVNRKKAEEEDLKEREMMWVSRRMAENKSVPLFDRIKYLFNSFKK